jgi:phosphoribosylformimino-5-aminoimidazole carboxamide ribonucleotide (ProFAR) isomerase
MIPGGAKQTEDGRIERLDALDSAGVALGLHVQLGGGMRTRATVEQALAFGVRRVVIGTRAAESEVFVSELVQALAVLARRHANLDGVIIGNALYEKRIDLADLLGLSRPYDR